jgi:hypothetical protein
MPTLRRLHVTLHRGEAMRVSRAAIKKQRLCYILVADKRIRYADGGSRIVYIGTTGRGMGRIAGSVAQRSHEVLAHRGVREFHVRIVSCQPRQNVQTWRKLERALLLVFKERYGEPPLCNTHGRRMRERDEFRYVQWRRIEGILDDLS